MSPRHRSVPGTLSVCLLAALLVATSHAQELPLAGHFGLDLVYATSPAGQSQLYQISPVLSPYPIALGAPVDAVPSRWAHRRRTLGAHETAIAWAPAFILVTPMGDALGNGALHLVDGRGGFPPKSVLVPTGNPAGYDLAMLHDFGMVFAAEDDGAGHTLLRGFSYATAGALVPLSPPTLALPGSPSAYVNRIGVDEDGRRLHVPTVDGVAVVQVAPTGTQMQLATFVPSALGSPSTNPTRFDRAGLDTWMVGTCAFDSVGAPVRAGFLMWDESGSSEAATFGGVPSAPAKEWVPAVGSEELALVSDGSDAYAYFLLREPAPGTFYVKGGALGVVRMLGTSKPVASTLVCSDACGEPFSIPTASNGRIAFETSFGPPFVFDPVDGGERLCIVYSPLHPLGTFPDGLLAVPDPLGGRISTKGMDRPLWTRDGTRVFASTSWFPGAPNPGVPGLEMLDVPDVVPVDQYTGPRTVVPNLAFPDQTILLASRYEPRFPALAAWLDPLSFFGAVFHAGLASVTTTPLGEIGQMQPADLLQATTIPNFPALFPASFDDALASTVPIPDDFGARRPTFNLLVQDLGLVGVTMTAALGDEIHVQATGFNVLAELGIFPPVGNLVMPLPLGWTTTTEFLSL